LKQQQRSSNNKQAAHPLKAASENAWRLFYGLKRTEIIRALVFRFGVQLRTKELVNTGFFVVW
jgi:hypothetical protein